MIIHRHVVLPERIDLNQEANRMHQTPQDDVMVSYKAPMLNAQKQPSSIKWACEIIQGTK